MVDRLALGINHIRPLPISSDKKSVIAATSDGDALANNRESDVVLALSADALRLLNASEQDNDPVSSAALFSLIDRNKDGAVSREEFIEARPVFVSSTQAAIEFSRIDENQDGFLTSQEIAENATVSPQAAGPAGRPPPPPPNEQKSALIEVYDEYDSNEDGEVDIQELLAGLIEEAEEREQLEQSQSPLSAELQQQYSRAIEAYTAFETTDIVG